MYKDHSAKRSAAPAARQRLVAQAIGAPMSLGPHGDVLQVISWATVSPINTIVTRPGKHTKSY